jgi:oligosaccharide repeat unit polymerase
MEFEGWTIHLIIIICILFLWILLNKFLFDDIASPFALILYSWVIPLLLTGFNFSNLETEWSLRSFFAITLVTVILVFSTLTPILILRKIPRLNFDKSNCKKIFLTINSKNGSRIIFYLWIILFSIYIYFDFIVNPSGFLLINYSIGGLSLDDAQNYNWMRGEVRPVYTSIVLILDSFFNIICCIYFIKSMQNNGYKKYLYFLFSISMIIFGFIKLSKIDVMNAFIPILLIYFYRVIYDFNYQPLSLKIKLKISFIILLIFLGMFFSTSIIRVNELTTGDSLISQLEYKVDEPSTINIIIQYIYTYSALNFENAARFVNSYDGGLNFGISGFRPLLSIFMQGNIASEKIAIIDWNTINQWAIAGTFISPIFAEFQWAGLIIFSAVYGFIINFLYIKFIKSRSIVYLFLYANFSFCWVFLFFSNAFATLNYYLNALFIILFFKLLEFIKNKSIN